jgi:hypothetical protein
MARVAARWLAALGALLLIGLVVAPAQAQTQAQARSVALLVGVGDYRHPRLNLEGPAHDVRALRDVLLRRWGFQPADVQTLVDGQATRGAILQALRDLQARTAPGDDVFVYFSGHGVSALQGSAELPVPHGSGAFVPWGLNPLQYFSRWMSNPFCLSFLDFEARSGQFRPDRHRFHHYSVTCPSRSWLYYLFQFQERAWPRSPIGCYQNSSRAGLV